MFRSMMQVYVKGSVAAVAMYQRAFDATLLCAYPDELGGYAHSELNTHGQILAVSELTDDLVVGNTMQFCFQLGEGREEDVQKAYAVLKEGARIRVPIGPCEYSSCMFSLVDRFGVFWCVLV